MIDAVLIHEDGECLNIRIQKDLTFQKQKLFVHYENTDENIMILSTCEIKDILTAPLLTFSLPPPLNYYVYPSPTIIVGGTKKKPSNLNCKLLIEHCAQFKKNITEIEANLAVYDIPLDETTFDDGESDVGEDEYFEDSDEDEQNNENDEDDWEEEEEDVVV